MADQTIHCYVRMKRRCSLEKLERLLRKTVRTTSTARDSWGAEEDYFEWWFVLETVEFGKVELHKRGDTRFTDCEYEIVLNDHTINEKDTIGRILEVLSPICNAAAIPDANSLKNTRITKWSNTTRWMKPGTWEKDVDNNTLEPTP